MASMHDDAGRDDVFESEEAMWAATVDGCEFGAMFSEVLDTLIREDNETDDETFTLYQLTDNNTFIPVTLGSYSADY